VEVFPHGAIDVRALFAALAWSYDESAWLGLVGRGLRRYNDIHSHCGETVEPRIVPANYWHGPTSRPTWPFGWYEGANGTTRIWVDCWQWTGPELWGEDYSKTSWGQRLMGFHKRARSDFHDGTRVGFLEVSCLTWHFADMGDHATSLVIAPIRTVGYSPAALRHEELADRLAEAVARKLRETPPSSQSVALRAARQARIEAEARQTEETAQRTQALLRAQEDEHQRRIAAQQEAQQLAQERERQLLARRKLAIIYDSCYLMGRGDFLHNYFSRDAGTIINIVPTQVKSEIADIIEADDDRRASAARGRGRILDLMVESDRLKDCLQCYEIDLAPQPPVAREEKLDADSENDRKIVAYGLQLLRQNEGLTVIIASLDGGIGYTVYKLNRSTEPRLFRLANLQDTAAMDAIRQAIRKSVA
jgi:hypothetical protein